MITDYKQLVQQINLAFEKGDLDFLAKHLSEDVSWQISGSRPITGKSEFLKCCSEAPLKDGLTKITVTNIFVDGNKAAAEGIVQAETLAGQAYHQAFCDIYHFDGDRIKTMSSYLDTAYDRETLAGGAIYQNK